PLLTRRSSTPSGDPTPAARRFGCDQLSFPPNRLTITSAADLSTRLLAGQAGSLLDDPALGQVMGGIGLADTFELIDTGRTGDAIGYAGTGMFVMSTLKEARQALEPQSISDFFVHDVPALWVEDRPQQDFFIWNNAKVKAEGKPFNLAKATLESLIEVAGMVPGPVGTATSITTTVAPNQVGRAVDSLTQGSCFQIEAPE